MGSEWNNLIYRVHNEIVDENNGDNKQVGDNWVDMSDKELGVNYNVTTNGSFSWCQEHYRAAASFAAALVINYDRLRILAMGGGLS